MAKSAATTKDVSHGKAGDSELNESVPKRCRTEGRLTKAGKTQRSVDGAREDKVLAKKASQVFVPFGPEKKKADYSVHIADDPYAPSSDDDTPSSPCRSIDSSIDSSLKDEHVTLVLKKDADVKIETLRTPKPEPADQGQEGLTTKHSTPSVGTTGDCTESGGSMIHSQTSTLDHMGNAECSSSLFATWPDPVHGMRSAHDSTPLGFHTSFHQEKRVESMQTPQIFLRNAAREICVPAEGCPAVLMRQRKNASYVWKFFRRAPDNRFVVICQECHARVRLGKENGCRKVGTTSMRKHMVVHHSNLIPQQQCVADFETAGTPSKVALEASTAEQMYHSTGGQSSSPPSMMGHPLSMEESLCLKAPIGISRPQAAHYTRGVAAYIAKAMLPFSTVEESSFVELCATFAPRWKVPSGQYFSTKEIPALAESVKAAMHRGMQGAAGRVVHFTSGIWTSNREKSYICVTAHWVGCNAVGMLEHWDATLALAPLTQPHGTHSIASQLRSVAEEWLSPLDLRLGSVTTDNGSNYARAFRNAAFGHIRCLAHSLNLVVMAAFRLAPDCVSTTVDLAWKIVRHFHHSSSAQEALGRIQARRGLPRRRLRQASCTRWNSTLHMLQGLSEQKDTIKEYVQEKGYSNLHVRCDQWVLMHNIAELLYSFDECIELLSHSDATLGTVLPVIHVITAEVQEKIVSFSRGSSVASQPSVAFGNTVLEQLTKSKMLSAMLVSVRYHTATFLDPRFRDKIRKYLGENAEENYNAMHTYILEQTTQCCRERTADMHCTESASREETVSQDQLAFERALQNSQKSSVFSRGVLKLGLCGPVSRTVRQSRFLEQEPEVSAQQELEAYARDEIPVDFLLPDSNPLHYWEGKCGLWPCLSSVSLGMLACRPTSLPSERLFSTSSSRATKLQTQLSSASLPTLSFIRSNRKWIPSKHCPLEDPSDHYAPPLSAGTTGAESSTDEEEDAASVTLEPFVPDEASCEVEEDV